MFNFCRFSFSTTLFISNAQNKILPSRLNISESVYLDVTHLPNPFKSLRHSCQSSTCSVLKKNFDRQEGCNPATYGSGSTVEKTWETYQKSLWNNMDESKTMRYSKKENGSLMDKVTEPEYKNKISPNLITRYIIGAGIDESSEHFEGLKAKILSHLAHYVPSKCPLTRNEIFDLSQLQQEVLFEDTIHEYGINVKQIFHNACPPILYEEALLHEPGTFISSTGALCCSSGSKTGRSPADKRIVEEPRSKDIIWWGKVNIKMSEKSYLTNRERALDYLNTQERLFVVDAFAGWDIKFRIPIRIIASRAYHALFMQNMLVMPSDEELLNFKPEFIVYNAGCFPANRYTEGVTSQTNVAIHLDRGEMVILGTQYAGEMKKGIFTMMMYKMALLGNLPLHSSCNVGSNDDISLFFGLSGTGKTTLSADPLRKLIGDDEHVWTNGGIFNIEGGCYAKCINLSEEHEPDIYNAIRFGSVLENVILDNATRVVDFTDTSITENTRASYPLTYIQNAHIPAKVDAHPSNIIILSCDAFGVLPPISKLTVEQLMYYFISGYTSKMAGTEQGVYEPVATFSACFGAPFLPLHPMMYATLLGKKLEQHKAHAWQINTGWIGGAFGSKSGRRIPLKYTRMIVDAIHNGSLLNCEYQTSDVFKLSIPKEIEGIPDDVLNPELAWSNNSEYRMQLLKLANLFNENMNGFMDKCPDSIISAGPKY